MAISTGANIPEISGDDIESAIKSLVKKKAAGRPTLFSIEIAASVLERLQRGETLPKICSDEGMPGISTVQGWKLAIPEFGEAYRRARLLAAEIKIDRGHDKIDALEEPEYELDDNGQPVIDEKGNKIKVKLSMAKIRLAEIQFKAAMETAKCYDREQFGNQVTVDNRGQIDIGVSGLLERMQSAHVAFNIPSGPVIDPILEERRLLAEAAEDAEIVG